MTAERSIEVEPEPLECLPGYDSFHLNSTSRKPVAIDLFCGLGGWTEALLAEGWEVYGFDVERHQYPVYTPVSEDGTKVPGNNSATRWSDRPISRLKDAKGVETGQWQQYPGKLILQDVRTIHGTQFAHADLIVASPPCQEFSYRAMPWKRAKALPPPYLGINLFWQCWRIQHEAIEATRKSRTCPDCDGEANTRGLCRCERCDGRGYLSETRYIPMVVENVKGAQKWIGRAAWHYGSFYLWGDVPALMPRAWGGVMKRGVAHSSNGETNFHGSAARAKGEGGVKLPGNDTFRRNGKPCNKLTDPRYGSNADGHKKARNWWSDGAGSLSATTSSKSSASKAASAQIAKIPQPLAQHIARVYFPESFARTAGAESVQSVEKSAKAGGGASLQEVEQ